MSFPPVLTWLELLPNGASCTCESGPDELRALIAKHAGGGGAVDGEARGNAGGGGAVDRGARRDADGSGGGAADAVVAINDTGAAERFAKSGFQYVRRLAVLPSFDHPRWLVPLDAGGAAAAAGLSLYTPARRSAHLKKLAVQLAARSGLKFWCRDTVTIGCRDMPPLEAKLRSLFPNVDIRLALSAGAPEPARNRKASAAVIDPRGNVLAFVKLAGSAISREIASHEAAVLPALARLNGRAPRLLFAGEVDGRYFTAQTPLPGKPAPAAFTPAHARFLESLQGERKLASETNIVATLPMRIAALSDKCDLDAHLEAILPLLADTTVPSTIIHGDFAPWNLRTHHGEISAFDWEYAELDGVPLFDQMHYQLQVGYNLHAWSPAEAMRCLDEIAEAEPLSLTPHQARAIQAVYFIDNLVRLLAEGYDPNDPMLAWYRQMLRKLAPASVRAPERKAALV